MRVQQILMYHLVSNLVVYISSFCLILGTQITDCRYFIDYENTDPNKRFEIHPSTGVVTIRNELDYETETEYLVDILAIDNGM